MSWTPRPIPRSDEQLKFNKGNNMKLTVEHLSIAKDLLKDRERLLRVRTELKVQDFILGGDQADYWNEKILEVEREIERAKQAISEIESQS